MYGGLDLDRRPIPAAGVWRGRESRTGEETAREEGRAVQGGAGGRTRGRKDGVRLRSTTRQQKVSGGANFSVWDNSFGSCWSLRVFSFPI
jgi:hypothetical protein